MIYVKGIVSFLATDPVPKSKNYKKNKRVHIQIMNVNERNTVEGAQSLELTCNFTAYLNEDYTCKSLEDYNGKVKPFLQQQLKTLIYRVEVHYLNYVGTAGGNRR